MKRITLLLLIMTLSGTAAISQNTYGVKAGTNFAGQAKTFTVPPSSTSQTRNNKPLFAFHAGVFFRSQLSSKISLHLEANFSLAGSKVPYQTEEQILNPDGKTHYYKDKIGYVEVPGLLRYSWNKFHIGAGPSVSFRLFSRITDFEGKAYNSTNYKGFDMAGNLIAGLQLTKRAGVNLRYSHGLLDIEHGTHLETKNRALSLSLLYTLK